MLRHPKHRVGAGVATRANSYDDVESALLGGVKNLRVGEFEVTKEIAQKVRDLLRANDTLEHLALNDNFEDYVPVVLSGLKGKKQLKTLYLWTFDISDAKEPMEVISEVVAEGEITHFSLHSLTIVEHHFGFLAKALETNRSITMLNLKRAGLKTHAAELLSQVLLRNTSIRELNLESNDVCDLGIKYIMQSLLHNDTLAALNVGGNGLTDYCGEDIGKVLRRTKSLSALDLSDNRFSETGAFPIMAALKGNPSILDLRLEDNHLDETVETANEVTEANYLLNCEVFLRSISSTKKHPWQRTRLMTVGGTEVGKTATIRSLLNLEFTEEKHSTAGIRLSDVVVVEGKQWNFQKTEHHAISMVCKISRDIMKEELKRRAAEEKRAAKSGGEPADLKAKTTERILNLWEDVETFVDRFAEPKDELYSYFQDNTAETYSARRSWNISVWDYGGQSIFNNLHDIFLVNSGIYLLVFSLKKLAENPQSTQELTFWLESLHLHAPNAPIIIVGTYMDSLDGRKDLAIVRDAMSTLDSKAIEQVVEAKNSPFFALDNRSQIGVLKLRQVIEDTMLKQSSISEEGPLTWMVFLDNLKKYGVEKEKWIQRELMEAMAKEAGIKTLMEVEEMLKRFHDLGMLVYLDQSEVLKDLITIDPQWLLDALSTVIQGAISRRRMKKFDKAQLKNDARLLLNEGIASMDLLRFIWDSNQVEFLVSLMQELLLLSNWPYVGAGKNEKYYLIPSMIKATETERQIESPYSFTFEFNFFPIGLFARLVCMCVEHSRAQGSGQPPAVTRTSCEITYAETDVLTLRKQQSRLVVSVESAVHAAGHLKAIRTLLTKLCQQTAKNRLHWKLTVRNETTEVPYETAQKKRLAPWFLLAEEDKEVANMEANFASFLGVTM